MEQINSKPDYFYKGAGKFYTGIHLSDEILVIRGTANGRLKSDFDKTVPFTILRSVRTYQDKGFWVSAQGVEIELNDLDIPVVRVPMNPKEQKTWISRLGQVCNMQSII